MISESWGLNLIGAFLLALIATLAISEAKSSSLIPRSLFLWPLLVIGYGILNLVQSILSPGAVLLAGILGAILILCGIQAALVNVRRLPPWPSGGVWLGLVPAGVALQINPLFLYHVMGFVWIAIGITKVVRERSASLEAGTPIWILLLYAQAVLLASYR